MPSALSQTLVTLCRELLDGPDADAAWILNPGDIGLLRSLDRLTAVEASAVSTSGGASIAAHVDHVRFGLSLMNRWTRGEANPWAEADWAASWERLVVTDPEWLVLRQGLADEARNWLSALSSPREYSSLDLDGVIASIAHLAYHLGAIRQIDRSIRGPSERETK
jgi:hypothetical protein